MYWYTGILMYKAGGNLSSTNYATSLSILVDSERYSTESAFREKLYN